MMRKYIQDPLNFYIKMELITAFSVVARILGDAGTQQDKQKTKDFLTELRRMYYADINSRNPYKRVPIDFAHLVFGVAADDGPSKSNFMCNINTAPLLQ
jgi:hypothetical protein